MATAGATVTKGAKAGSAAAVVDAYVMRGVVSSHWA